MIDRILSQRHHSIRHSGINPNYARAPAGADVEAGTPPPIAAGGGGAAPKSIFTRKCIGLSIGTLAAVALVIVIISVAVTSNGKKKGSDNEVNNADNPPFPSEPSLPDLPPLSPTAPGTAPAPPPKLALTGYAKALDLAIEFYDVQKTGKLPKTNPIAWRGDSFLNDATADGHDVSGGYFDAGDGLKFTFPMAWSMTMIGWALTQYESAFTSTGTLDHALEQLRWGTDWLLKTWLKDSIVTLVGEPEVDHTWCWWRPEDFPGNLSRRAFSQPVGGATDVIMEVTAALATASVAFKDVDPKYSTTLLTTAMEMHKAVTTSPTKGRYSYKDCTADCTKPASTLYGSTFYEDEIQWANMWMYKATNDTTYLQSALTQVYPNPDSTDPFFSWENKKFGVGVLLTTLTGKLYDTNKAAIDKLRTAVEGKLCRLPAKAPKPATRTPGGLLYLDTWGPAQYAASTSFLANVYSDFLNATGRTLVCGSGEFSAKDLTAYAKAQTDYLLGQNPLKMSYMVGFGDSYPKQLHHRAASIPMNATVDICFVSGDSKWHWRDVPTPSPNIAFGAVSGGPTANDSYADVRVLFATGEPSLSTNAPFLAALASMVAH